jgi:hypothetical protein
MLVAVVKFEAKLEPVSHGGHFVVVPAEVAAKAGVAHASRVRGTVNGAPLRSSVMKYSGVFHLGVHKATLAKARATEGDVVAVAIELDDEPLPGDVVPDDLAKAIAKIRAAKAAWERLRPSHKREHVKAILEAKKPETRARRVAKAVEMLLAMPAPASARKR